MLDRTRYSENKYRCGGSKTTATPITMMTTMLPLAIEMTSRPNRELELEAVVVVVPVARCDTGVDHEDSSQRQRTLVRSTMTMTRK